MYRNDRLVILDADGTTIDAFGAIDRTFSQHGMNIGALERFQKRRNLFKYLGGIKEFPTNLRKQVAGTRRSRLIATLTEVYREEAALYPGIAPFLRRLTEQPNLRVGIVTRNITLDPVETLARLFRRHGCDPGRFDFVVHLPLRADKRPAFRDLRERFAVNPARACACGDEGGDYLAAVNSGIYPFMVSYGFEDHERLRLKHGVPQEVIARTPQELAQRVLHALGLLAPG
jgi:phosphoglycolate phosphatase